MRFESLPVADAAGAVLGHNTADAEGRRLLRKGTVLGAEHCAALARAGHDVVWVARLGADDVDEDVAATRIAAASVVDDSGLRRTHARTGRVNMVAEHAGVVRVDVERLTALNGLEGVTLATLHRHVAVGGGKMVGTLKIIPYGLSEPTVATAEATASGATPLLSVAAPIVSRVGLVLSGSPLARERVEPGFRHALGARLSLFDAAIETATFVDLATGDAVTRLASVVTDQRDAGIELIILAGETAIMDARDIAPRAIEAAGGSVACFGAPVDPGNLLLIADLGGIPILGAPGCARSPKTNVVDHVLPRLLVGDRLDKADIVALGHGGLLEDVPERRLPRSWVT